MARCPWDTQAGVDDNALSVSVSIGDIRKYLGQQPMDPCPRDAQPMSQGVSSMHVPCFSWTMQDHGENHFPGKTMEKGLHRTFAKNRTQTSKRKVFYNFSSGVRETPLARWMVGITEKGGWKRGGNLRDGFGGFGGWQWFEISKSLAWVFWGLRCFGGSLAWLPATHHLAWFPKAPYNTVFKSGCQPKENNWAKMLRIRLRLANKQDILGWVAPTDA